MEQAKTKCDNEEADAVRQIFAQYLNGASLTHIAESLSAGKVRYHAHTELWNKNMIKRILEDERYLGNDCYPKIINDEDFLAASLIRADKNKLKTTSSERVKLMRSITVCAVCGTRMSRRSCSKKRTRWTCQNKGCRETAIIEDNEYISGIDKCIGKVIRSPQLLDVTAAYQDVRSLDVLRLENELSAAMNRGTESAEYIKMLIFAIAVDKYNLLPDMSNKHKVKELKAQIIERKIDTDTLVEQAVHRILLSRGEGIKIELINSRVISPGEEANQ